MPLKIENQIIEQILKMYKENIAVSEIAKHVSVSKQTIYHYLKKNNLKTKRKVKQYDNKLIQQAIDLYQKKKSYAQISKITQIPETTLKRKLKKMGYSGHIDMSAKIVGELHTKALELHNNNLTNKQIADKLNVSTSAIRTWIKNNKLIPNCRTYTSMCDGIKEDILVCIKEGYGVEEIARKLNISAPSLRNWLKKNNIHVEKYKTRKHIENREKMFKRIASFTQDNNNKLISSSYNNNVDKLIFKCQKGHEFKMSWFNYQKGHRCPKCSVLSSKTQEEIFNYIKSIYNKEIIYNTKSIISPLEIDIYVPEKRLAIEYNGLYWHSELYKHPKQHYEKYKKCKDSNINLFAIYEDEWDTKRTLIKAMIRHRLGILPDTKLRASSLKVKKITQDPNIKAFFNSFHIDGHTNCSYAYALMHENKIVSCLSVRRNMKNELEIARFASDYNIHIYGGFSKLMKAFIKDSPTERIISFSNNRLSHGNIYTKFNFKEITDKVNPSYWYTDFKTRLFRTKCKKINDEQILKLYKTEREQAIGGVFSRKYLNHEKPLYRIYDYGHRKWEYKQILKKK